MGPELTLRVFGSALFKRSACSRSHGGGGFRAPGLRRCGSTADQASGGGSRRRRQRWRRSSTMDRGGDGGSRQRRRRRRWRLQLRGVLHRGLRWRRLGVLLQSSSRLQLPPRLFLLSAGGWRHRDAPAGGGYLLGGQPARCSGGHSTGSNNELVPSFGGRMEAPAGGGYLLGGQPARCSGGHSTGSNNELVNHSLDTVAQTLSSSGPWLRWVGHEPNGPAPLPPETGRAQPGQRV
uniref:Uncharacterized protein n=1 Tax=Oryza barthii TaxID=65489 RepID=A0A0D3F572_9ORYZ